MVPRKGASFGRKDVPFVLCTAHEGMSNAVTKKNHFG